jgi:hypothetical protein
MLTNPFQHISIQYNAIPPHICAYLLEKAQTPLPTTVFNDGEQKVSDYRITNSHHLDQKTIDNIQNIISNASLDQIPGGYLDPYQRRGLKPVKLYNDLFT